MTIEKPFQGSWRGQVWKGQLERNQKAYKELLEKENLNYDPKTKLKELSISDIQMFEIIKAVSNNLIF